MVQYAVELYQQGEPVNDASLIDANRALMPELGDQLSALRKVVQAKEADNLRTETGVAPAPSLQRQPPNDFPGYEVVREVSRGGQGVVYQAIQKTTKRKVAIKVLLQGPFAGRHALARFEREVQVLGQLKHPNIVTVHDSGSAAGSMYLVMDYISGKTLDDYLDNSKLTMRRKLELFVQICDAVSAAHLRGVIHRDLKPSNVRVDSDDRPYVLDFGLAKLATGEITDESRPQVMTETGQFLGSLSWAAPEQAEGTPDKIDMRTDVYALGVIIYHMLAGRFPYEVTGSMHDVLGNILHADPRKPSTLTKNIDDELDTIIIKCLRKDRESRYQSAGELARDLRRYLAGEPIEAKRNSGFYILKKTMRRYRLFFGMASAFLVTLGVGSVIGLQFWRSENAKAIAERIGNLHSQIVALRGRQKYDEVEQLVQQALEVDSDNLATMTHAAYNYFEQTRDNRIADTSRVVAELENMAQRMRQHQADNHMAILYLAHVYKLREQFDLVFQLYKECIATVETPIVRGSCQCNLGALYAQRQDFPSALGLLQQSVEALGDPEDWHFQLWRNLASVQLHVGHPEARASIEQAKKCAKLDSSVLLISARIALENQDVATVYDQADLAFDVAEDHDHASKGKARRLLALAFLHEGDHARAFRHADEAATDYRDQPTINHLIMSIAKARQGKRDSAQDELQRAKRNWPPELDAPEAVHVTTVGAFVWIETGAELYKLMQMAEELLRSATD